MLNRLKLLWELAQLKGNEKKSPQQLKKLQKKKLRRLLTYAFRNSAYHHRAFVRTQNKLCKRHNSPTTDNGIIHQIQANYECCFLDNSPVSGELC